LRSCCGSSLLITKKKKKNARVNPTRSGRTQGPAEEIEEGAAAAEKTTRLDDVNNGDSGGGGRAGASGNNEEEVLADPPVGDSQVPVAEGGAIVTAGTESCDKEGDVEADAEVSDFRNADRFRNPFLAAGVVAGAGTSSGGTGGSIGAMCPGAGDGVRYCK